MPKGVVNTKILKERLLLANKNKIETVRGLFDIARNDKDVELARQVKSIAAQKAREHTLRPSGKEFLTLYWEVMLWLAQNGDFESFCLYMEKNRPPEKRFYQNRRAIMKPIVDAIQDLMDDRLDELFISLPPRVGKTTFANFLTAYIMGMEPESTNLYCSCNTGIAETYFKGVMELITDDATYTFFEIFPEAKVAGTNSKEHTLDMGRPKRYPTLRCVSIDQEINGKADCNRFLIADDLCSGIEEAMSPDRLAKLWSTTQNNLIPRQVGNNGKIIWIGTRWSLFDPIGKQRDILENEPKFASRKWKAIDIPALDENDESNFDFPNGMGFSTEQYIQRRSVFERDGDMASWLAQYMAEPIERSGQVFDPNMMRFYNGVLPDREPDRVFSFVDTAFGGGDYVSAPVAYQYDDEIYIHDVVFDNGDKSVTRPRIVECFIANGVGSACFEGTKTTAEYREWVDNKLRERGHRVNIMSKSAPTQKRKNERIFEKSPEIREFYFRDTAHRNNEYAQFMRNVHSFTMTGKNKHDDGPDSLAGLCDMIRHASCKARIIDRPF